MVKSRFSATTVHLEHITTALNCLTPFGSKDDILIYIDHDGLSFVKDNNGVIRISLLLAKELFSSYHFATTESNQTDNDGDDLDYMKLCVKINHILDSVSVVNKNLDDVVECILSYDGRGSPFSLTFEDSMISERVDYSTYLIKEMDTSALELDRQKIILECILKGEVMHSALKDLKEINCKDIYLYANVTSNGDSTLAFISRSQLGLSKIKFPSNKNVIEKLEIYDNNSTTMCYDKPVIGYFNYTSFNKIILSTKIASKILLRMDVHGILSINILSHTDNVMMSEDKFTKQSSSTSSKRYNSMQLPKDYPGIVIDVCMIEKEPLDMYAQEEIHQFMGSGAITGLPNSKDSAADVPQHNILSHPVTEYESNSNTKDTSSSSNMNEDLPMFF
ncbi:uncharacterized protein HLK63_J07095 [Nakaseomyces glabratus]|nr:uncharacterized protein GW608_J07095 [Nakaseomyces glabratus]UCS27051.1 uncharacterized protein HLK63_J07095 [Nakaseomyces glabratus]UCS32280.1 uncharacterized protein HLK64_J07095 [Nakaseomyces glabratus]UCS37509.1 uncharacterized protein HLK62_J07095 [Nakaseomyces glabratus]